MFARAGYVHIMPGALQPALDALCWSVEACLLGVRLWQATKTN